jgi:hypothetical protein
MRGYVEADEFCGTTICVARGAMNPAMVGSAGGAIALDTR